MFRILLRIALGYALASVAAAAALVLELWAIEGGVPFSLNEFAAAAALIGIFAWSGLLFALWGQWTGWTRPATYAFGGILAMSIGVVSLSGVGLAKSLWQGHFEWSPEYVAGIFDNSLQLLLLGLLPGLAGGLAFWLVAVAMPRRSAV